MLEEKPGPEQGPAGGGLGCRQPELGWVLRVQQSGALCKETKPPGCCAALPRPLALLSGPVSQGKE